MQIAVPAAIANTYRFFVAPALLASESVQIDDPDLVHQISKVLRMRPGDSLLLLDGQGTACAATLTSVERRGVQATITSRQPASGEPATQIILHAPLIRAEPFEWLLQKATEIGVQQIVPVLWQRSRSDEPPTERKVARWQRIIREAAEQACRGILPALHPATTAPAAFAHVPPDTAGLLLWEARQYPARSTGIPAATPALRHVLRHLPTPPPHTLALFGGPEGGIAPDELTDAIERGMIPVSLGTRILRAETAPLVAAAAILYELEADVQAGVTDRQ